MAEPEKIYRFLRVLEYMGTAERIKESRERRSVKGTIRIKDLVINEAILGDTDQLWLLRLMAGRDWIWIEGNHDAGPVSIGGSHLREIRIDGLQFRHIATPDTPEISGHYHPKARLAGRSQRCFLIDRNRVILPAYGTYTGGLWSDDPALTSLMQATALAVLIGKRALPIPMPRDAGGR